MSSRKRRRRVTAEEWYGRYCAGEHDPDNGTGAPFRRWLERRHDDRKQQEPEGFDIRAVWRLLALPRIGGRRASRS